MTTDDPTTPARAAVPDRAKPPGPPDPATGPVTPPATTPVDAAYADAVRLGAASPAGETPVETAHPADPHAGTAQSRTVHTNGTYTNGTDANGTYRSGTDANGTYPDAPRPGSGSFTAGFPGTVPPRPENPPFEAARPEAVPPAVTERATGSAPAAPTPTGRDTDRNTEAEREAEADAASTDATRTADAVRAAAGPVDAALVDAVLAGSKSAGADGDDSDEPIRTLLWTAATYRPLEEVAALVALLKSTGAVSSPADEALRAAAVVRPLEEVRQLVAMLNEAGHPLDEADTALRAAAVGRPIEDVAELVSILGTGDAGARPAPAAASASAPGPAMKAGEGPIAVPENPNVRPPRSASVTPSLEQPVTVADLARESASPALRSGLRWPAAAALFACGVIHLPTDLAGLRSGGNADTLAFAVTVLCLVLGLWLGVRDTVRVWAAAGATAIGVVALHAVAGGSDFDPLGGSVGAPYAWASAAAVMSAALAAALAGAAVLRRQREPDATNGT